DDEIVAEIPIYLTHDLAKNLHLLQYPQRSGSIKPGELLPSVARIKPIHGQIEMDIPLDVQSPMYNKERGLELGAGLSDNNRLLDITTLVSVNIPKNSTYAAGVFQNGELHLTPIEKITQLRPSLKYLDRVAEKELAASKLDIDDEEEEYKEVKAQTPWSKLLYFDVGTEESNAVYSKLFASNREHLTCKDSPDEYLTKI
ncbi:Sin-like protein conserved region-domain-containing protein, partial [Coemansia spiralis]